MSLYLRQLDSLRAAGQTTVSSQQLGKALRVTDAQVRKDLAYFGQFGRPGLGYRVDALIEQARLILGTNHVWATALVGAGNLGRALAAYRGFAGRGLRIAAVFDTDMSLVGRPLPQSDGLIIRAMSELSSVVNAEKIRIGIIAVPAPEAQATAQSLLSAGVLGLLNFAPVALDTPPGVPVV
ncbi:MAG: redox-sensing transcriptional repressor Rex, partial [Phycisphaerae bacterium]|nr:redox-sensing transcriptional repressor Rex [Phycisphaerae bacterium]